MDRRPADLAGLEAVSVVFASVALGLPGGRRRAAFELVGAQVSQPLPTAFGQVVECVARGCEPKQPVFPGASPTFVEPGRDGRYIFSRAVACRLLAYRSAIELVRDEGSQRLFRVVLGSTGIPEDALRTDGGRWWVR